mgnify:CR=1 FL=1
MLRQHSLQHGTAVIPPVTRSWQASAWTSASASSRSGLLGRVGLARDQRHSQAPTTSLRGTASNLGQGRSQVLRRVPPRTPRRRTWPAGPGAGLQREHPTWPRRRVGVPGRCRRATQRPVGICHRRSSEDMPQDALRQPCPAGPAIKAATGRWRERSRQQCSSQPNA